MKFAAVNTLQASLSGARIVSAKLKVFTMASATSDSGEITIGLLPRDGGFYPSLTDNPTGITNEEQVPYGTTPQLGFNSVSSSGFPIIHQNISALNPAVDRATQGFNEFPSYDQTTVLPLRDGAAVFWLPEDPQSMQFIKERITLQYLKSSVAAGAYENATPILDPFAVIGITGATVGTQLFFDLHLNIEATVNGPNSSLFDSAVGSMTSTEAFTVAKIVGGNRDNYVVPNPSMSLGQHLASGITGAMPAIGRAGRSVARSGLKFASKYLFGSSDIGDQISAFI